MPKVKIPAVVGRVYKRVFICMRCNAKIRADMQDVKAKRIKCRKCNYKGLRPKSKERKI